MCRTVFLFDFLVLINLIKAQNPLVSDINSLSELPLDKLLQVKQSFEPLPDVTLNNNNNNNNNNNEKQFLAALGTSQAHALQVKLKHPYDRGGYETHMKKKGGKKGLSTIFQISITALAFLAFGGYLLCLLVQAIKSKQTTTTTMTTSDAVLLANLKKRRPGHRHRRSANLPGVETAFDTESMYYALRMFSEGFVTYYADNSSTK